MSKGLLRRWSQSGAPKLWANQYGSVLDLLEAVLVTGYGSFPGLGWTKEFESSDESIRVFKPNTDSGYPFYLQVMHNDYSFTPTNVPRFNIFESMSDYDTGENRLAGKGGIIPIETGTTTGSSCPEGIHWMIIGDDRGFWFCLRPYLSQYPNITSENEARYWRIYYIGEYVHFDHKQKYPICLLFSGIMELRGLGNMSYQMRILRASDNEVGSISVGVSSGSFWEKDYESTTYMGSTPDISPYNGITLLTPIMIHESYGQPIGMVPGIYNPLMKFGSRGILEYGVDEEWDNGKTTLHLINYFVSDPAYSYRFALISGEGFRDVI